MNLNVDMNNLLPVPLSASTEATTSTQVTKRPDKPVSDTLRQAEKSNTSTTVTLESDNPVPTGVTNEGTKTLLKLGPSSATTGPGGPGGLGNPWFKANATVAFTLAMLDYFSSLRENKSAMGEMLVQQIGVTFDLAKDAAALAIAAAEKERNQYIVDACLAGAQMAVSLAGAAIMAGAAKKAADGSKEMKEAKGEMADAAVNEDFQKAQTLKKNEAEFSRNKVEIDKSPGEVGTGPVKENSPSAKNVKLQKQIDETKTDMTNRKADYERAEKNYETAERRYSDAERRHNTSIDSEVQFKKQMIDAANHGLSAIASSAKAWIAVEKGAIEAEKQIIQGMQEIQRRITETINASYAGDTEKMNEVIQSINKWSSDRARQITMTRN